MLKRIKDWTSTEVERLKVNTQPTDQKHIWIARIWTGGVIGEHEYLLSVPFTTEKPIRELKAVLKKSQSKFKVTHEKIELDGEYIL